MRDNLSIGGAGFSLQVIAERWGMSVFPDWERFAVPQKREETGCIPTGYEMILRAAGATGIEFATFQDDFDLDKDRKQHEGFRNNFESVAAAVRAKYPQVVFESRRFDPGCGQDKLRFIEDHVSKKQPLLISLAKAPYSGRGWHIMPVVDMDESSLTLLEIMRTDGAKDTKELPKTELVRIHNNYPGGDNVAFLKSY